MENSKNKTDNFLKAIKKYADEHKGKKIQDIWKFKDPQKPKYPTEKNGKMIEQIILQSSDKNSIVLDCFAGSGSTLKSAYNLDRKWIGIDNSKAAIKVIKNNDVGNYTYYDFESGKAEQVVGKVKKQIALFDKESPVNEDTDIKEDD